MLFPEWYPDMTREPWLRKIYEIDYPSNTGGGSALVAYQVVGKPPAEAR